MKATGYDGIKDVVERAQALGSISGMALGAWLIKAYEVGQAAERDRVTVSETASRNAATESEGTRDTGLPEAQHGAPADAATSPGRPAPAAAPSDKKCDACGQIRASNTECSDTFCAFVPQSTRALPANVEDAIIRAAEWVCKGCPVDEANSAIRDVVRFALSQSAEGKGAAWGNHRIASASMLVSYCQNEGLKRQEDPWLIAFELLDRAPSHALRSEGDALALLKRFRQWDQFDAIMASAGDGPYWKREIDATLDGMGQFQSATLSRDDVIEECAKVCDALRARWDTPLGTSNWKYAFEEAALAIRALRRTESRNSQSGGSTCENSAPE